MKKIIFDRIYGLNPLIDIQDIFNKIKILHCFTIKDDIITYNLYYNIKFIAVHIEHHNYNEPFKKKIIGYDKSNSIEYLISNNYYKFCKCLFSYNNNIFYINYDNLKTLRYIFNKISLYFKQDVIINYSPISKIYIKE